MTDRSKKPHEGSDVYQRVTDQIVAAIENGAGRWEMPWHKANGLPSNVVSGKEYRGVNVLTLWGTEQHKGYPIPLWATYNQWGEKGAQVKKGEKATLVVFWKFSDNPQQGESEIAGGDADDKGRLILARSYPVFNAAQVDGFTPPVREGKPPGERDREAEEFFAKTRSEVRHGGGRAFYSPSTDHIQMPAFDDFKTTHGYYGTLAHEHTHWTGAKHRLARDFSGRFGDSAYAFEELIAELGASYLCARLGLESEPRPDHAAYLGNWLKVLKDDKRAIFTAASHAQKAADYLHELQVDKALASEEVPNMHAERLQESRQASLRAR